MENNQQSTGSKNKFWLSVALLSLVMLFTFVYKFKDILKPSVNVREAVDLNCDLRKGACTTVLEKGGTITFLIDPIDIPLLKPLKLSVVLEGVDASKVEVDFVGIGMEMGYNRSLLKNELGASGSLKKFTGEAILSFCSVNKMKWEARVLLHQGSGSDGGTGKGVHLIPYRFFTIK